MIIFIEAMVILFVVRLLYLFVMQRRSEFNMSKHFVMAIFAVLFLVLPAIIKVWMIIVGMIYLYFRGTGKSYAKYLQIFSKE